MTPEVHVLELLVEVHQQLFRDSIFHNVPNSFLLKHKDDLKLIARHVMIAITVLNKIIEEEKLVDKDVVNMQTEFKKFFSHIHKKKDVKKEINELYKKADDALKLIEDEEAASKYVIDAIDKVLRNLEKLMTDFHNEHLDSHFMYLLNLDGPRHELKEAFEIMKRVWEMDKKLEKEDFALEHLLMELRQKGVHHKHPVFTVIGKKPRDTVEEIACLLHKMELAESH